MNDRPWTQAHCIAQEKVAEILTERGFNDDERSMISQHAWYNAFDVPVDEEVDCFLATIELYLDQDEMLAEILAH